jgi:hypothetical protein
VRVQDQRLTPGVQRREDARLCPKIHGVRQQGTQGVADRLKQQRRHHRDVGQPQRVELMGQGKDDMVMITGQKSGPLAGQPALGLEIGGLWSYLADITTLINSGRCWYWLAFTTRFEKSAERFSSGP